MEFPLQVGLLVSMVGWRWRVFSYRHVPVTAITLEYVFVPHVGHAARFSMCHVNRFSCTLISHTLDCWHTSIQSRLLIKHLYKASVGGSWRTDQNEADCQVTQFSCLGATYLTYTRHFENPETGSWSVGDHLFIFSFAPCLFFIFVMKRYVGSRSPRNISCRHRGGVED